MEGYLYVKILWLEEHVNIDVQSWMYVDIEVNKYCSMVL